MKEWFSLLFLLFSIIVSPSNSAFSAEITKVGDCEFLLFGTIRPGDSDLYRSVVSDAGCAHQTLHLNSPGGSVLEALEIAREYSRTTTKIDAGATCESSCALLFMAGRTCAGAPYYCSPTREMHRTGTLGFHAPFLEETRSNQLLPLKLSFSAALEIFSQIQDAFSEFSFDVRQTGYKKDIIPSDLMAHMFSTPPEKMYNISNNDQFHSFDITVVDDTKQGDVVIFRKQNVIDICYNLIYSNMRGWNYSSRGFSDYENSADERTSGIKQYKVRPIEGDGVTQGAEEYFVYFENLNMGIIVSGWCKVTPDFWSSHGGYFQVSFFGELSGADNDESNDVEETYDLIASDNPTAQEALYRFSEQMHYTMAFPLQTPLKNAVIIPTTSVEDPVAFVERYFRVLNMPEDQKKISAATDFWVETKRGSVASKISRICGAHTKKLQSDRNGGEAVVVGHTSVEPCGGAGSETYIVEIKLKLDGGQWKIATLRSRR